MIKINDLTAKEFCKKHSIAKPTFYGIYRTQGEQGIIDFLNRREEKKMYEEPTQKEVNRYYRRYRERLNKVEEEAKETKAKLIKELAVYQALTVILAVALIVVLGV